MAPIKKIFIFLLTFQVLGIFMYVAFFTGDDGSVNKLHASTKQNLFLQNQNKDASDLSEYQHKLDQINALILEAQQQARKITRATNAELKKITPRMKRPRTPFGPLVNPNTKKPQFTRKLNPFFVLGAYPKVEIQVPYENVTETMSYDKNNYGLINDPHYCEKVDYYNLAHPNNIFRDKNFFTDYGHNTIPWKITIPSVGKNLMPQFSKYNNKNAFTERKFHLDLRVNSFFINMDAFHKYHIIGKNFLCATQIYNHIPGHRAMIRKDDLVESVKHYAKKFEQNPQCFNKKMIFPQAYKLNKIDECKEFFEIINSETYKNNLVSEPIQYLIKIGHGAHSGDGVFLLDSPKTISMNSQYNNGEKCGQIQDSLMAQTYVSNALLLDMHNKFDFRIYMLVASTNPLMVYYHDGFLRVSLSTYDKFSTDRMKHLTNTHLAESLFNKAKTGRVNGMTGKQLREYHVWTLVELEDYLLQTGKISSSSWLDDSLRPQFKKAMIHLVRMSSKFFWKQSNVYGLFGLDFMLDDNLNLWFIECNPNPGLFPVNKQFTNGIKFMLRDMFEIEHGLYRSRMKRVFTLFKKLQGAQKSRGFKLSVWKAYFQTAMKNKFEPEYKPSPTNKWELIMDENLKGLNRYQGLLDAECI